MSRTRDSKGISKKLIQDVHRIINEASPVNLDQIRRPNQNRGNKFWTDRGYDDRAEFVRVQSEESGLDENEVSRYVNDHIRDPKKDNEELFDPKFTQDLKAVSQVRTGSGQPQRVRR